jgi:hypothetical protein
MRAALLLAFTAAVTVAEVDDVTGSPAATTVPAGAFDFCVPDERAL